jgi:hypothetical protein
MKNTEKSRRSGKESLIMGIPVVITPKQLRNIGKVLREDKEVICLDLISHSATLLVARHRLGLGQVVKAKIIKGYKDNTPEKSSARAES